MSRKLILMLLMCSVGRGAYVAPNAATTHWAYSGTGIWVGADRQNGGGCTTATWDPTSLTDHFSANGGPTSLPATFSGSATSLTISDNGSGKVRLTDPGANGTWFASCNTGSLALVLFSGVYDEGVYQVTVIDADSIDLPDLAFIAGANTADTNVGGIYYSSAPLVPFETIQDILDSPEIATTGTNERVILIDAGGNITIPATIAVDTNTGVADAHIVVKGVNTVWVVDGTQPVITTGVELANGLLEFFNTVDYTEWHNIDFNGGGKDATKAAYCVNNETGEQSSHYHLFQNCIFRGASKDGIFISSFRWTLVRCEAKLNGENGIWNRLSDSVSIISCHVHDNDEHGIEVQGPRCLLDSNKVYDNGKDGSFTGIAIQSNGSFAVIRSNTCFNNTSSGFFISALACVVYNNTSVGNVWGYDLNGKTQQQLDFFGYNHSFDNSSGHVEDIDGSGTDITNDVEFQTFRHGNNRTGDPKFTSVVDGSEDFIPLSGSDLIGNGLDPQESGNQAIGAIQPTAGGSAPFKNLNCIGISTWTSE